MYVRFAFRTGRSEVVERRSWYDGSSDRFLLLKPLRSFSFHPLLYNWFCEDRYMYYPASRMVDIKDPLQLTKNTSPPFLPSFFPSFLRFDFLAVGINVVCIYVYITFSRNYLDYLFIFIPLLLHAV